VDPVLGSLVYQLPGGITLEYDLRLGETIAHWKCIDEEIHLSRSIILLVIIEVPDRENVFFRPLKWPRKFRTQKVVKNSKWPKNFFEVVGIGGWTPISTWIIEDAHKSIIENIYQITGHREDYINPTVDGEIRWRSVKSYDIDSEDVMERWKNKLYELSNKRYAWIKK
jgi:hypothetical protein